MPQGMFTPRIKIIICTYVLPFRIDFSTEISTCVTVFIRHGLSRRNQLGSQNLRCLQVRCRLRNRVAEFGVKIFPNDFKTADRMKICFTARPALLLTAGIVSGSSRNVLLVGMIQYVCCINSYVLYSITNSTKVRM